VRQVPASNNLTADVEGDIAEVDGVLRIASIRIRYHLKVAPERRETVLRLLDRYADACPAYQSVKGCIDCSWTVDLEDA
jgi:hypothetical protein